MATGEGKTLVATFPAYLNALTGKGVHVVTVNDYLAARDSEWMGEVYRFLNLTVGCIQNGQSPDLRRQQYHCDIVYGTNSEMGFDYLRDNGMATTQGRAGAARARLRHRRRGRQHPDRRGAHAAHHRRAGHGQHAPVRQVQGRRSSGSCRRRTWRPTAGPPTRSKQLDEGNMEEAGRLLFKIKNSMPTQQAAPQDDRGARASAAPWTTRNWRFTRTRARRSSTS